MSLHQYIFYLSKRDVIPIIVTMKLHIVVVGQPKLAYAKTGFEEYRTRLQRLHAVRVSHIPDKYAYDADKIASLTTGNYRVALVIDGGKQFSSPQLADFLKQRELEAREVCFMIGGPDGLPEPLLQKADLQWSFSPLTFPHDLAMIILLESLYRATTINAGHPYHH